MAGPLGLKATWGVEDWSAVILRALSVQSVLLRSGVRSVIVDGSIKHVPRFLADATATWVDELEEIPDSAPQADDITLAPKKAAVICTLSNESIEDSVASELDEVGGSLARAVANAIEKQFFSKLPATSKSPAGIFTQTIPAGDATLTVDAIIKASSVIEGKGGRASVAWLHPDDLGAIRLAKEGDGSNRPLLDPDVAAGQSNSIYGVSLVSAPAIPKGNALVAEVDQVVLGIGRQINVSFSPHARFSSDAVLCRVTARVDWNLADPAGLVLIGPAIP